MEVGGLNICSPLNLEALGKEEVNLSSLGVFDIIVLFRLPLDCKEIKSVNPKGNQPWMFTGRTDAEAETLILWPSDAKCWFIGKDPDAGK